VGLGAHVGMDDSSFFGTPEVVLRPRQRHGGDQGDYPTPVAGFSTNKKLRDNMSFSAFSPGSVLRKPFYDVSAALLRQRMSERRRCVSAPALRVWLRLRKSILTRVQGGTIAIVSKQQATRGLLANGIPEGTLVPILRAALPIRLAF
jgi:hypothetical protein